MLSEERSLSSSSQKTIEDDEPKLCFVEVHDSPLPPTQISLDEGIVVLKYICCKFSGKCGPKRKNYVVEIEIAVENSPNTLILKNGRPYKGGLYYFQDILIDRPGKWVFRLTAVDGLGNKISHIRTIPHYIYVTKTGTKPTEKEAVPQRKTKKSSRNEPKLSTKYRKRSRKNEVPMRTCSREELQRAISYSRSIVGKKRRKNKRKLQKFPNRYWLVHEALAANETYVVFSKREMLGQLRAYGHQQMTSKR